MLDAPPPVVITPSAQFPRLPDGNVGVALNDFLVEPSADIAHASEELGFADAYARLLVASARPVLLLPPIDIAGATYSGWVERAKARLFAAGVPCVEHADEIESARLRAYPTADLAWRSGLGSTYPTAIFVGERHPQGGPLPFGTKSGRWLLPAIAHLGIDEIGCHVANAYGVSAAAGANQPLLDFICAVQNAASMRREVPRPVVALGGEAAAFLARHRVDHVRAPHPAWHRRFHYDEGPRGYASRLVQAGAPFGPILTRDRARVVSREPPRLPPPFDAYLQSVAPMTSEA